MLTIGVVGPMYADSFVDNIVCGFEDLGHRAFALDGGRPAFFARSRALGAVGEIAMRSHWVRTMLQRRPLLKMAKQRQFDAFVFVDQNVTADNVELLGKIARPVCFWFPDAVSNLGSQTMLQAPFDAIFSKEPRLVGPLRDVAGFPAYFLSEACNPRWHAIPSPDVDPAPHIAVMGNFYPYRIRMLERLHAAGVPMKLYGNPFPRWMASPTLQPLHTGRYVTREEKARVFRGATAVLNAVFPSEIEGLNCRLYEATASGACVISEERSELGKQFSIGDEVLAYSTFDELVDLTKWCLQNPGLAREIGDRGSLRAHADHTYAHRLTQMLDVVGLGAVPPGTATRAVDHPTIT